MGRPNNLIVTGEECATNEFIDGKRVYRKRIDCGILPNATNKDIDTGLDFINSCTLIRMSGMAKYSSGLALPLPFVSVANLTNNIQININTEKPVMTYNLDSIPGESVPAWVRAVQNTQNKK